MTENRRFLLDDIKAMLPQSQDDFPWLMLLSDDGLYHLWQDLVNLTEALGISHQRVSQLEQSALKKLRIELLKRGITYEDLKLCLKLWV